VGVRDTAANVALGRHDAPSLFLQFVEIVIVAGIEINEALLASYDVLLAQPERSSSRRMVSLSP
jgi:hypothetical protein